MSKKNKRSTNQKSGRQQKQAVSAEPTESSLAYPLTISFTVAAGTLLLQLLQTRIFGVVFWNHLVYFIISIALLGFGISGTWLSFGRNSWLARRLTMRVAAVGFVLSALFSSFVVPQLGINVVQAIASMPQTAMMFFNYAAAVLPYFFGGWMLGCVFRDYVEHIHKLYFADLIGAGLGCLAFLALIQPLGAVILIALTCGIVALPVLWRERQRSFGTLLLGGTAVLLVATIGLHGAINRSILPDQTKAFFDSFRTSKQTPVHEFSEWNAISRIDVRSVETAQGEHASKRVFIDGDAWTGMVLDAAMPPPPYNIEQEAMSTHRLGYLFTDGEDLDRVLVIGSGGGIDVHQALRGRAKHVDAIEINPTTYRLMTEDYSDAINGFMVSDRVSAYNEEGRGFVRNSPYKYDSIIMHGIDTFAAINTGAYVLSENYLYTVEGITDYVSHLSDDGILVITRWLHRAETPRLFAVCLEALYRLGVEHPEKHIILSATESATILVKRSAFTDEQVQLARDHLAGHGMPNGIYYPLPEDDVAGHVPTVLHKYAAARRDGGLDAYLATLESDIGPVFDDSPFFFHFDKPSDMMRVFRDRSIPDLVRGHWPSFTLFTLLGFTTAAVFVFMFLPLRARTRPQVPHFGSWLVYFSCLGVAFIFVEIALMQRFALLLGHPSRSLALVLAGLLISSGVGSQLRGRWKVGMHVTLPVLAVFIIATAFVYPAIIDAVLGMPIMVRGLVTLALVVPLGLLMGMPFPTGLQAVSASGDDATPWMWGVNGGTTVVGSILAIILAIWGSFTIVLCVAAAAYGLAGYLYYRNTAEERSEAIPPVGAMPVQVPDATVGPETESEFVGQAH